MEKTDRDELEGVLDWVRGSLPPEYAETIETLVAEARQDSAVTGVLLTGSLARRDALPGTDIDVRILRDGEGPGEFERDNRDDLLLERTFTDERSAQTQLAANPMHVYAYLDGRILYDSDGALSRLRSVAERVYRDFRAPRQLKADLAEALGHPEDKIRVGLESGDLLRAVYCLSTSSWGLIEGLWAANDRPLPPNSSVRPHLRDLAGPDDLEAQFERLFLAEPRVRAETGLFLLGWIRHRLGG
ncbi:nucleotidyltransferase domain-containing protein [Microlunatus speluncae]|uniref:nucleotidyltransferase domain-containing protein n=1 Tax=Microlunatus speluncae TaxID=2594267 RepID=UPI0012661733|nr:nucleotidyltransferase domain-containing protein [Microlunatus speluncae]